MTRTTQTETTMTSTLDTAAITTLLKTIIDRAIEAERRPIVVKQDRRNGWAGYQNGRRCTKFYFTAERAQQDVDDQLAS
jgi:hypothetical protein